MHFAAGYGAFLARSTITPTRARALADAGLRHLVIQVDWQRSRLPQRSVEQLRAEQDAARLAGLEVWWWAWCTPARAREEGRRPAGPRALEQRLRDLVAVAGAPAGFFADCEVGGGWTTNLLAELPDVAWAARGAGMLNVGLTSHGRLGPAWHVDAFDLGAPQLYEDRSIGVPWVGRCLGSWAAAGASCLWPVLGCADEQSTATVMRGDLDALAELDVRGALWWTVRQLKKAKLEAAVPELGRPRVLPTRVLDVLGDGGKP